MMEEQKNPRGFSVYQFDDSYGAKCSLQESSAATLGHIWLGMDKDADGEPVGPTVDGHKLGARMHLSRAQVADLLPYLQHFVAYGTLGILDGDEKPIVELIKDALNAAVQDAIDRIEEELG